MIEPIVGGAIAAAGALAGFISGEIYAVTKGMPGNALSRTIEAQERTVNIQKVAADRAGQALQESKKQTRFQEQTLKVLEEILNTLKKILTAIQERKNGQEIAKDEAISAGKISFEEFKRLYKEMMAERGKTEWK